MRTAVGIYEERGEMRCGLAGDGWSGRQENAGRLDSRGFSSIIFPLHFPGTSLPKTPAPFGGGARLAAFLGKFIS